MTGDFGSQSGVNTTVNNFCDVKKTDKKYNYYYVALAPVRARGLKSRMCHPYPQRVIKGD